MQTITCTWMGQANGTMNFCGTQVVLQMHAADGKRLNGALPHLGGRRLPVSPTVALELQYLHEIRWLAAPPPVAIGNLAEDCGRAIAEDSLAEVVKCAMLIGWTSDAVDRLTVVTSIAS